MLPIINGCPSLVINQVESYHIVSNHNETHPAILHVSNHFTKNQAVFRGFNISLICKIEIVINVLSPFL